MLGNSLEYRIRIKDHPESGWLSDQRVVVMSVTEERLEEKLAIVRNCYPDMVVIVTVVSEAIAQQIPAKGYSDESQQNCGSDESGTQTAQG